ncbi:MAG: M28 family peptidase [Deltaproteobacteria bacterium]|nr:M28 family peptidase [Deltaproteobacteria bacterium]
MIDPQRAFARLVLQHELGPRFVGSPGHGRAQELLRGWLAAADVAGEQVFVERFFDREVTCRNLWGEFAGDQPGRLLLGSHYDTRPWADLDPDEARRREAVPGANDGGSGVALLCELAVELKERRNRPTVQVVLFDAEDWHEIDGKEVSLGARHFAAELAGPERPDAVIVVDMVGGRDLMLDVDVNCQAHDPSYRLTLGLFQLGHALALPACSLKKAHPYKWIGCDHTPFMAAGIPTALLIDLDYPEWHTTADRPAACAAESLGQMGSLLDAFLFAPAPAFEQRVA